MRGVPYALAAGGLLLALTWLLLRGMNPQARSTEEALHTLDTMAIVQSALQRDILRARAGLLRNYDSINAELDALRAMIASLRRSEQPDPIITAADTLAAVLEEQERLTEQFKTTNAVLQNSLSYFGLFSTWLHTQDSAQKPPEPVVTALTVSLMQLTLDASPATAQKVAQLLAYLAAQFPKGEDRTIGGLIAHGRILHRALPDMDRLLKALATLPVEPERDALRSVVRGHGDVAEVNAQRYRYVLYALSLLLLVALVVFGLRLKARTEYVRRRAALEHVIARISGRFVNASRHEIDGYIELALSELARQIGADRAYLLAQGPPRTYDWRRDGVDFPGHWPADVPMAAAAIGQRAEGGIHVADVNRLPPGPARNALAAAGIGGWACVCVPESGAFLGFDAVGPEALTAAEEVSLLRMALDAMADALHRQRLEVERGRLEANLQRARRMETVGALASGIAHNFNNIIGAILGYAEIAQTQTASGRLATSLDGIRAAGARAQDLIEQILAFGRRTDPRRAPVALHELLAEARSMLTAALSSRIEVSIREDHGTASISGDAGQLQQVILNLCSNAAQAMDESGRILIETRAAENAAAMQLSHGRLPPGRYCVIAVEDHGRGMSPAIAKRVFEPFFTTRAAGNGLGLATVREIVGDHAGAIDVRSSPDVGTRFEVWLPCAMPERGASATEQPGALILGQGETILVIAEDRERLLRDEETLAALGYEPIGFTSPSDALDACRASPERFDVALVGQPHSEAALKLACALHAAAPSLAILVAAASSEAPDAEALLDAGVFELVRKPLNSAQLAGVLARCASRL
jgi:signal transduction histidine kinase